MPWTVAHQALLSMGFSRQEYWSGLPFPTPGDLPNSKVQPASLALAGGFFTTVPPGGTRRDKKALLNEQRKQREENNRMGKTRDLIKKIRTIKGIFHAWMSKIKDRNDKYLTEAEEIKKRWQKYTELYKKGLNDPDKHDGVVTHLELDILECEVKWALGSITTNKASGGDGIPAELFQILKDDSVKALHSMCQQIWKIQQRSQD